MKKKWSALALILAGLLLFAGCEERRTVDISDGGDLTAVAGKTSPAPAEIAPQETAEAGETETGEEERQEPAPTETPAENDAAGGAVTLVEMELSGGGTGMCLVPLESGGVFVINGVLSDSCVITTAPKDLLIADCTVSAETGMDAELEYILTQGEKELIHTKLSASLAEGENSVQVLLRLDGPVSGEYTGTLFINGERIGSAFTGGDTKTT